LDNVYWRHCWDDTIYKRRKAMGDENVDERKREGAREIEE